MKMKSKKMFKVAGKENESENQQHQNQNKNQNQNEIKNQKVSKEIGREGKKNEDRMMIVKLKHLFILSSVPPFPFPLRGALII